MDCQKYWMVPYSALRSEIALNWLKENNFTRVKGRSPNALEFAEDEHCPDVFVFNTADRATIMESQIVRDRFLIVQVRASPTQPLNFLARL